MTSPRKTAESHDLSEAMERKLTEGLAQVRAELSRDLAEKFSSAVAEIRREHDVSRISQVSAVSAPSAPSGSLAPSVPLRVPDPRLSRPVEAPPEITSRVSLAQAFKGRNLLYLVALALLVGAVGFVMGRMLNQSSPRRSSGSGSASSGPITAPSGGATAGTGSVSPSGAADLPRGTHAEAIADAVQAIRRSEAAWSERFRDRQLVDDVTDLRRVVNAPRLQEAIDRYLTSIETDQDEVRIVYALLQDGLNQRNPARRLQVDGLMNVGDDGLPDGNTGRAFLDYLKSDYLPVKRLEQADFKALIKALGSPDPGLTLSRAVVHDRIPR
jgi:hypothetical protein